MMIRTLSLTLIIAVVLGILLLLNYYPYRRIVSLFHLSPGPGLALAFLILAVSFPSATLLTRWQDGLVFNIYYLISAGWLGLVFFGCAVFGALHLLQLMTQLLRHPIQPRLVGWLSVGLTLAGGLYGLLNASLVHTTRFTLRLSGLERPMRIVQLSDVHLGAAYGAKYLRRLVDRSNALRPDLVAITGDVFDGSGKLDYQKVRPLEKLSAPAFFVTGNHENYEGAEDCCALIARTGVRVLRNELTEYGGLQIIGLDTPKGGSDQGEANHLRHLSAMPPVDPSRPAVLLYHIPLGLKKAAASVVDLMLSGHTHNGQLFPFTLFMPLAYRHYRGHFEEDGFHLIVSQGAGTWGPPMRIGSKSEIVVIDLIPE